MRVRAELRVEKRDGRVEWLRATKLIRSVMIALATESEAAEASSSAAWSSHLVPDQGGRSVPVAMPAVSPVSLDGADEELAYRIAEDTLADARCWAAERQRPVASSMLWAAVRDRLRANGRHVAAERFAAVRTERERRLRLMHDAGFASSAGPAGFTGRGHTGASRRFGADGTDASRGPW